MLVKLTKYDGPVVDANRVTKVWVNSNKIIELERSICNTYTMINIGLTDEEGYYITRDVYETPEQINDALSKTTQNSNIVKTASR